jgi:fission process protein 1
MSSNTDDHYDVFKDSKLRYVGYSNEIGEAFRPIVPISVVRFSYLLEMVYFISDTLHKGVHAYTHGEGGSKTMHALRASSYTMLWQFLASVAVPAFAINRCVKFSGYILRNSKMVSVKKVAPTLIGLWLIPLLPYVLDPFVDGVMNKVLGLDHHDFI